jgi:hypothetical protein
MAIVHLYSEDVKNCFDFCKNPDTDKIEVDEIAHYIGSLKDGSSKLEEGQTVCLKCLKFLMEINEIEV